MSNGPFPNCDESQWTLPDSYIAESGWTNPQNAIDPVEWFTYASCGLTTPDWSGWLYLNFDTPIPAQSVQDDWSVTGTSVYIRTEVLSGGIWWYLNPGTTPLGGSGYHHYNSTYSHWHNPPSPDESQGWISSYRVRFKRTTAQVWTHFYYARLSECIGVWPVWPRTYFLLA